MIMQSKHIYCTMHRIVLSGFGTIIFCITRATAQSDGDLLVTSQTPIYIVTGVCVVLMIVILICACAYLIAARRAKPYVQPELQATNEPDPENYKSVMDDWSPAQRRHYEEARAFMKLHPPITTRHPLTDEQRQLISERGVEAWQFLVPESNPESIRVREDDAARLDIMIHRGTELNFTWRTAPSSAEMISDIAPRLLQTNLPVPTLRDLYYFEVKLVEKPANTEIAVGFATRPYPDWRMPGFHEHSVGYMSNSGKLYVNNAFEGRDYGSPLFEGDVVGVAYQPRTGSIYFTRNGVQLDTAVVSMSFDLYPTIAVNGPCTLEVNFGQSGFVYIEANIHGWRYAQVVEETLLPPPAYGSERGSILLESAPTEIRVPDNASSLTRSTVLRTSVSSPGIYANRLLSNSNSIERASLRSSGLANYQDTSFASINPPLPPPYTTNNSSTTAVVPNQDQSDFDAAQQNVNRSRSNTITHASSVIINMDSPSTHLS